VALRRKPSTAQPPAELLKFDAREWAAPDAQSWDDQFRRWKTARHHWVDRHPDSVLGDLLDVLRVERQVRRDSARWVT